MPELYIGNLCTPVHSIFRLIGKDENALTYALGYMMSQNPSFLIQVLKEIGVLERTQRQQYPQFKHARILLQERKERKTGIKAGIKDITIEAGCYRIVIEAKTDGSVPREEKQLRLYTTDRPEDWQREELRHRFMVVLARKKVDPGIEYHQLLQDIRHHELGIQVISAQWGSVLKAAERFATNQGAGYWSEYLRQLVLFMKEDYKVQYFEEEVLCQNAAKTYDVCNLPGMGYYFNASPRWSVRKSLFFVAIRRSAGEYMRPIENDETLSAGRIGDGNHSMSEAFVKHCDAFPDDAVAQEVRVLTLGNRIPIPKTRQRIVCQKICYKKLVELLSEV